MKTRSRRPDGSPLVEWEEARLEKSSLSARSLVWTVSGVMSFIQKSKKLVEVGRQNDEFGSGHQGTEELVDTQVGTFNNQLDH